MKFSASSKVLIHGIGEPDVNSYVQQMVDYGTQVLAAVEPGLEGTTVAGVPVYDMVERAIAAVGRIDIAVLFVPPYAVLDAGLEAIASGIRQLAIVTGGVPPLDVVQLVRRAEQTETEIVGPNSPGVIVPGEILVGVHPPSLYMPGPVGIVSRCGSLVFEVAENLTAAGLGQSACVGVGSDTIVGSPLTQWLEDLDEHEGTEVVVLVGHIGGSGEVEAAQYVREAIEKPVVAYIAGHTLHPQQLRNPTRSWLSQFRQPKAKAINSSKPRRTGAAKKNAEPSPHPALVALQAAQVPVATSIGEIPALVRSQLQSSRQTQSSLGKSAS
jgi:succinyl-CoA synthetase alpha subunit